LNQSKKNRKEKKRENRRLAGANANMPRNYRLDADDENAGVGIVVKNNLLNAIKNVKQISDQWKNDVIYTCLIWF
jgi:hypothetical protein